ncbi:MAG TPA: Shedu anti-phage system protein SduA domain-containing protein [Pirellulales bacterium]|nr:Shedu anti-phage system protein SduA domain-containing protein [Pirellulales bacterium]
MKSLEKATLKALDSAKGERAIADFLKRHYFLVARSFNRGNNFCHCFAEFELGDEYRADFLVLAADSGCWYASFIELESHRAKLYLKDGTPSRTLRTAQRQIEDWKNWCHENETILRKKLSRYLRQLKAPSYCSNVGIHRRAETEILDQRVCIDFGFHIVIGRRATLSADEQERRAKAAHLWGGPEIATYDRFVDLARRDDEYHRESKSRAMRGDIVSQKRWWARLPPITEYVRQR